MVVPAVRPDLPKYPGTTRRVDTVSRKRQSDQESAPAVECASVAESAEAAAAFLAGQEITRTLCGRCGTEIHGINGRYSCGNCGWSNAWSEGHRPLPTAEDDPDWPGL